MTLELEKEFMMKISKLKETLKELHEKPPTPTKEEMCEKLMEYIELGDNTARELYEEACRETQ